MISLNQEQVETLLGLIPNEEDRKTIQAYLQIVEKINAGLEISESEKRSFAKQFLDTLNKIGFEVGKHAVIGAVLNELLKLLHDWHVFD